MFTKSCLWGNRGGGEVAVRNIFMCGRRSQGARSEGAGAGWSTRFVCLPLKSAQLAEPLPISQQSRIFFFFFFQAHTRISAHFDHSLPNFPIVLLKKS